MHDAAEETDREMIYCVKCGYTMGRFGNGSNCDLVCPRCRQALEIIVAGEDVVVSRKTRNAKRVKELKA